MPVAIAYLDTLNSEPRRAVEHGLSQQECAVAGPLLGHCRRRFRQDEHLGASSSHLIVNGADPRRILLMTFSRGTKRVERISRKAMGDKAGVMTDALAWAGTFHGIGARLLREYFTM
jgi:DNA helicase-2/ATP-dependent DNA helicase PcrA